MIVEEFKLIVIEFDWVKIIKLVKGALSGLRQI